MTALESAGVVVLVLSQAANDSPEVQNEIVQAGRHHKVIVPVQIEPVTLNSAMEFSIRRLHWLDATQGLSEWSLDRLLETVVRHLRPAEQAPTTDADNLTTRALRGDKEAQFELAERLSAGQSPPDHIGAVQWLRKAAESGHAEAAYRLALHLRDGLGVLRSEDAALHWFEVAAHLGNTKAQTIFANELLLGRRTSADLEQALFWFDKAAEGGSVEAQFQLGMLLENGRAGKRDYTRASRWLESAAQSGHIGAQFLLATVLVEGKGRLPDLQRARYWAQAAADRGNAAARLLLSRLKTG